MFTHRIGRTAANRGSILFCCLLALLMFAPRQGSAQAVSEADASANLTDLDRVDSPPESDANRFVITHARLTIPAPFSADGTATEGSSSSASRVPVAMVIATPSVPKKGVAWGPLIKDSLAFLALEHTFRVASERETRERMKTISFGDGYFGSVGNLHGWADGDEFYVNYVGHPMQGAVSGYIWQHNDRAYNDVEFGKNRRYWKSKLRSLTFSFVYSAQFELGPVSEASIGYIQGGYPQVGFVDLVITPTIGMGWTVAEDFLDRKIVQPGEMKFSNSWFRMLLRSTLNPSRSLANALAGNVPWHRDDRPGVFRRGERMPVMPVVATSSDSPRPAPVKGNAPFDFQMTAYSRNLLGSQTATSCRGGDATAAFRINPEWQFISEVGGCKITNLDYPHSGDMLDYSFGTRWTYAAEGKWSPHLQALIGGTRVTQELVDPAKKLELVNAYKGKHRTPPHDLYSINWDANSLAVKAGAGVDYKINSVFSLRVLDLNYAKNWLHPINGIDYSSGLQLNSGLVLHVGNW